MVLKHVSDGIQTQKHLAGLVPVRYIQQEFQRLIDDRFIVAPRSQVAANLLPNHAERVQIVQKPHFCEEITIRLTITPFTHTHRRAWGDALVFGVLVALQDGEGLLVVDERAAEDQKEGQECDLQVRRAAVRIGRVLLAFGHGLVEEEDAAREARVELVVVVVDLDEHEGLAADHAGDDVHHEGEGIWEG